MTLSLRKHSGKKPWARRRAWPGYEAIPCTVERSPQLQEDRCATCPIEGPDTGTHGHSCDQHQGDHLVSPQSGGGRSQPSRLVIGLPRGSHRREPPCTDSAGQPRTTSGICRGGRHSARLPRVCPDPLSMPGGQGGHRFKSSCLDQELAGHGTFVGDEATAGDEEVTVERLMPRGPGQPGVWPVASEPWMIGEGSNVHESR